MSDAEYERRCSDDPVFEHHHRKNLEAQIAALKSERDELAAREKPLREALGYLLDSVDYTQGACVGTDRVGAALPLGIIKFARAALATAPEEKL